MTILFLTMTINSMKKLNEDQLEQMKSNYASMIVDGMDKVLIR